MHCVLCHSIYLDTIYIHMLVAYKKKNKMSKLCCIELIHIFVLVFVKDMNVLTPKIAGSFMSNLRSVIDDISL